MSEEFLALLPDKNFVPNIVIFFQGVYFAMREPDSGQAIDANKKNTISDLVVNPTTVDPQRASVTISSVSFKLLDRGNVITSLFNANPNYFQNEEVEVYIGRSYVALDFANYYKLPTLVVNGCSRIGNDYSFSCIQRQDNIDTNVYSTQAKLAAAALDNSTTLVLTELPAGLPSSGMVKIDDEFISYTSTTGAPDNFLNGCVRGELSSVPAAHDLGATVYEVNTITGNIITLLLQLLISPGGGGAYDVLTEGAGIDQNLIDVTEFENIRTRLFPSTSLTFNLYNIGSLLKFLETEFFFPFGLRLRSNNNTKMGLGVLNKRIFTIDSPVVDEGTTLGAPAFKVDQNKVINQVRVYWDWNDVRQDFDVTKEYKNQDSIDDFGAKKFFEIKVKGVQTSGGGVAIADALAAGFLNRFAYPKPEIDVTAQIDTSYLLIADKTELISKRIPTDTGDLNFAETVEVVSRAINWKNGQAKFKLAFTSSTGLRQCYIAPSDSILTPVDLMNFTLGAGRGDFWRPTWKVRLRVKATGELATAMTNEIKTVIGDDVEFVLPWDITPTTAMIMVFATYDEVTPVQQKYCFIGCNLTFNDAKKLYSIVCEE
jgi:hypothetical protein